MRIVNTHAAEDGESLDEVFVIFREWQLVEFIDQLDYSDDIPRRVFDRHAEDRSVLEPGAVVYGGIKTSVFVCYRDVDSLFLDKLCFLLVNSETIDAYWFTYFSCCGHISSDANVDRKSAFKRTKKEEIN